MERTRKEGKGKMKGTDDGENAKKRWRIARDRQGNRSKFEVWRGKNVDNSIRDSTLVFITHRFSSLGSVSQRPTIRPSIPTLSPTLPVL